MTVAPALHVAQQLFIGVDVAKTSHVAGFVSQNLLTHRKRFDRCPTFSFANSRSGFETLLKTMRSYADLHECVVLMERTGHYHLPLQQYLHEHGITVYEVHAARRMSREKTDKRDALSLANALYSQVALGTQVLHTNQGIQEAKPPTEAAAALRALMRRRYELMHLTVSFRNKLTAISDELFPEFTEVFKDPNAAVALAVRTAYPSPHDMAAADLNDLIACRQKMNSRRPGNAKLAELRTLATRTIGTKHPGRVAGLLMEQRQLIAELRQAEQHLAELDAAIDCIVAESREGRILLSIPGIAAIAAGEIIAAMGTIGNFESAAKLRGYFGWAPVATQTGASKDHSTLTKGGNRTVKKAIYLLAWRAVNTDTEFRIVYERLIKKRCAYDARLKRYVGKNKVIGRICGQIIGVIYTLLQRDYEQLRGLRPGEEIPEPALYNREVHSRHRKAQ